MGKSKERIDLLLVQKGLIESRESAKKHVMAGLVFADNMRVDKPGTKVFVDCDIIVKRNLLPYVSRGGLKLEKALKSFPISVDGKIALDIGASTGGFTDCMLQNGAKRVYAIDVGYGQLAWKIRNDSRVIVMERTNIRHVRNEDIGELAQFASIDVSFISLKLVLPVIKKLVDYDADIIALIKPQFEAGREKVGRKGVVRDINVHKEVITNVSKFCKDSDLSIVGLTYSPVKGAEGNIEYLAHIKKNYDEEINIEVLINSIVTASHEEL